MGKKSAPKRGIAGKASVAIRHAVLKWRKRRMRRQQLDDLHDRQGTLKSQHFFASTMLNTPPEKRPEHAAGLTDAEFLKTIGLTDEKLTSNATRIKRIKTQLGLIEKKKPEVKQ
jgi:hypothetical protein